MAKDDSMGDEMRRMQQMMDRFFDNFGRRWKDDWNPFADERGDRRRWRRWLNPGFMEREKEYVIEMELPGVKKEEIKVDSNGLGVEIRVERKKNAEKKGSDEEYEIRKSYAGFYRHIYLPDDADTDNINASFEDGLLRIKVPKKLKAQTRKEVKIK